MRLGFTSFKHVGIFPEQSENWDFMVDSISEMKVDKPQVLNLFAYTGGASVIAKAAGADVTHVDSVKQVITWSKENMEASGLDNIRWIVEDALKFVKREVKRGKKYQGIVLDPPAYGRGADGEKWILEDNLNEMLKCCKELLDEKQGFLILNLYSMGFSALIAETLINQIFKNSFSEKQMGELFLLDKFEKKLPLGVFWRGKR
jgi:23S rRNA (cytosine1962-C5)-methyltransferase